MRLTIAYTLAVVVTLGSLSVVMTSCASRRNAPRVSQQVPPAGAQNAYARVTTREQALYNNDVARVQQLEEFQDDMDERLRLLDEGADDALAQSEEEEDLEGRNKRFWTKVGVASYAVLSVAVSLGMAALPFLI